MEKSEPMSWIIQLWGCREIRWDERMGTCFCSFLWALSHD